MLALLLHAPQQPPPPVETSIPVIFTPPAPEQPDPAPQLVSSSIFPVQAGMEPAALDPLPPLHVPASPMGYLRPISPRTLHREQSHPAPTPVQHPSRPAPPSGAPPAIARAATAPGATADPVHDTLRAMASWEARIRQAVQDAAIYPASARLLHRDGSAQVRFDYDRGAVENASIAQSSHVGVLDGAALSAVTRAVIPGPPPELGPARHTMLVWVQFRLVPEE